jgi:hypothetical protein
MFLQGIMKITKASVKIDFVSAGIRIEPFPNECRERYCLRQLAYLATYETVLNIITFSFTQHLERFMA